MRLLRVVRSKALKDLSHRHVRSWVSESLIHALAEPIVDGRFLSIEGPNCGPHNLAR
jgi:hypothetical protein